MHVDPGVALAGLIVGFTVGLTGMGGGALMTPILVLILNSVGLQRWLGLLRMSVEVWLRWHGLR